MCLCEMISRPIPTIYNPPRLLLHPLTVLSIVLLGMVYAVALCPYHAVYLPAATAVKSQERELCFSHFWSYSTVSQPLENTIKRSRMHYMK